MLNGDNLVVFVMMVVDIFYCLCVVGSVCVARGMKIAWRYEILPSTLGNE